MMVVRELRRSLSLPLWMAVLFFAPPAAAVAIDFESGLAPTVYALEGVGISSDQEIFLGEVSNTGTSAVQGFHVFAKNGTDFPGSTISLSFDSGALAVAFDWYSSTLALGVEVSVFGPGDSLLATFWDTWDSTLTVEGSQAGFHAGSFSIDLGGTEVRRVFIADDPVGRHVVGLDNLAFTLVPEPTSGCLLALGLVASLSYRTRRY
jgi:hypothetical protein